MTDVIRNPATGERIAFREATDAALRFEYSLAPGGFALGRVDHVHPRGEERFDVRSGRFGVRIDGEESTAPAGTGFAVRARTPHTVWNDGDEAAHAAVEIRHAGDLESFFRTTFGLARDGRTNRWGLPGPLQLAVIAEAFREEFAAGYVPLGIQRALVRPLAAAGRRAGYRARYPEYEPLPLEA